MTNMREAQTQEIIKAILSEPIIRIKRTEEWKY